MQCPIDGETLIIADRSGVEIDYCPKCRGVWLDRGELDKIIDRVAPELAPQTVDPDFYNAEPHCPDQYREPRKHDEYRKSGTRPKRRKSFAQNLLEEVFDFD